MERLQDCIKNEGQNLNDVTFKNGLKKGTFILLFKINLI